MQLKGDCVFVPKVMSIVAIIIHTIACGALAYWTLNTPDMPSVSAGYLVLLYGQGMFKIMLVDWLGQMYTKDRERDAVLSVLVDQIRGR